MRISVTIVAALALTGVVADAQQPLIYPAKDQTASQQNKDMGECTVWAKQTTGVDPAQLAQYSANAPRPSGPQGEVATGAVGGALLGTAVGAVAGDAGKGAAIGAITGTVFGGARQRRRMDAEQQQAQQTQQQVQAALAQYNKAFSACMEGRGYVVK
jgi:Glycine zipper